MSYQVFAIKTRPQSFDEVIGQTPVVTALKHALEQHKLHHAYLFTGTRGVGKTTLARIIAKAVNCEQGISANPCNHCDACQSIMQGKFPDLIEIDAASKTKVEDTRALLETVIYAPTRGKYKIYLIDEVHMLSTHSFNALLKTLEEPPSHVKFLLATTDPQKIPATILSRCLQFTLKWVEPTVIAQHLQNVLQKDKISFEPAALQLLAAEAEGSVRDALSLLEQAVAIGAGQVTDQQVREMLGRVKGGEITNLINCIVDKNNTHALTQLQNLAMIGADFEEILTQLIYAFHQMAVLQQAPELATSYGAEILPELQTLAKNISSEDLQIYYQIALLAKRDLPYSPQPKLALEMALMRMIAFVPVKGETPQGPSSDREMVSKPPISQNQSTAAVQSTSLPRPVNTAQPAKPTIPVPPAPVSVAENNAHTATSSTREQPNRQNWHLVLNNFNLNGIHLQILKNSVFVSFVAGKLHLDTDAKFNALINAKRLQEIEKSISEYMQNDIKVVINTKSDSAPAKSEIEPKNTHTPAAIEHNKRSERYDNLVANFQDDPNIKEIIKTFNGELKLDSVKLAEDVIN